MKKFLVLSMLLSLVASLFGCGVPAPPATEPATQATEPTGTTAPAPVVLQSPMIAISLPMVTENHTGKSGDVIFYRTYQNISLTLPESEVADKIILDFLNRTDTEADSLGVLESAQEMEADGVGPLPLHTMIRYTPMRVDRTVISLYGFDREYTGGAHSNFSCVAVTYDLTTGNALSLDAVLCEDVTAEELLQPILDALEPQFREGALFEGYEKTVETILQKELSTYKDWYLSPTGLCFCYSPYELGPFASGDIVAQIPYEKLAGILKDAYFPAEKDIAQGSLIHEEFEAADLTQYSQIAEVILAQEGNKLLLYTNSRIEDLRIEAEATYVENPGYLETYTVFACESLTPGDAIVIQTAKGSNLTFTYTTGAQTVTETLEIAQ